jgi:hypothetical protein
VAADVAGTAGDEDFHTTTKISRFAYSSDHHESV